MSAQIQPTINVNVGQLMVGLVVSLAIACGFIAYITNTIINSKVDAISQVQNPVTPVAAPQTNTAGGLCIAPNADAEVTGTTTPINMAGITSPGSSTSTLSTLRHAASGGSVSLNYNQSNTSNNSTSSVSTITDNRNSGNTRNDSRFSGNTLSYTDTSNSGNTITQIDSRNSGNTTNTNTTVSTITNTIANSGNTTTTNTDNSNNSINTLITDNTAVILP